MCLDTGQILLQSPEPLWNCSPEDFPLGWFFSSSDCCSGGILQWPQQLPVLLLSICWQFLVVMLNMSFMSNSTLFSSDILWSTMKLRTKMLPVAEKQSKTQLSGMFPKSTGFTRIYWILWRVTEAQKLGFRGAGNDITSFICKSENQDGPVYCCC